MTPATVLLLILAGAAAAGASDHVPVGAEPPKWERYEKVVDFNIFVRQRGRRAAPVRRDDRENDRAVAMPAPHMVLRGVSRRGGAWIAFVEDIRSGQVVKAASGDELNGGRVESISMAGISYSYGEAKVDVAVGGMIGASRGAPGTAMSPGAPASPTAGTKPAAAGSANELSILERLRRKREAQLGKSKSP